MSVIEEVFFLPPMAVARLGGSDTPLASFTWVEDPSTHGAGNTVIEPAITLQVLPEGPIRASIPGTIQFRDGDLLRPVAPFFELWAKVKGEAEPQRLTAKLLTDSGGSLDKVTYTVTAANHKAARRTGDDACAFTAQVRSRGDDHVRKPLLASSQGTQPLVPSNRPIPLGQFQVIQPQVGESFGVNLDQLRVRFTPATGEVYGPPNLPESRDNGRRHPVVKAANQFLNRRSSWLQYNGTDPAVDDPQPSDTYDGASRTSLGVVDDTCDAVIEVLVQAGQARLQASARVFSGPPDFAPDRRPFMSLADDLIDRDPPSVEPAEELADLLRRMADLFQRVFETVSLANVDAMRASAIDGQPRGPRVDLPRTDSSSMTPADRPYYRDEDAIPRSSRLARVPFHDTGKQKHEDLADADDLALFLRENAEFVQRLIRPPYGTVGELDTIAAANPPKDAGRRDPRIVRDTLHDMRMPPYMRDSDATAMSLTRRQYNLLMRLVAALQVTPGAAPGSEPLPTLTNAHVTKVLERRKKAKTRNPT